MKGSCRARLVAALSLTVGLWAATGARAQSWHVAIEQNQMQTPCKGQTIPVDGAKDCAGAQAAAWKLLNTLLTLGCVGHQCPAGSTFAQGAGSCREDPYKRKNGSQAMRYQVDVGWKCVPPSGCPKGQAEWSLPGTTLKYCCEGKPGSDRFCCTKQAQPKP